MPATIHTLRVNRFGAPPLLIISDMGRPTMKVMNAYVITAEPDESGRSAWRMLQRWVRVGPRDAGTEELMSLMRMAMFEGVKHYAAELANKSHAPVDEITIEEVDQPKLLALRSLGLYRGLEDSKFDEEAAELVYRLERPIVFESDR